MSFEVDLVAPERNSGSESEAAAFGPHRSESPPVRTPVSPWRPHSQPSGAWNRSWEEWLLQVPSLTCDLGKSQTLFLLRQLNRDATSLSASKAVYFEKQAFSL
ncbi:uncharacterized protein AAES06_015444 [Glossophaga mutica]